MPWAGRGERGAAASPPEILQRTSRVLILPEALDERRTRQAVGIPKALQKHDRGHRRLVRIADLNGNSIEFSYHNGVLTKIEDNLHRTIALDRNQRRLVERIRLEGSHRAAQYKYNEAGELIYSEDADGNKYAYRYDSHGRHNLVSISGSARRK